MEKNNNTDNADNFILLSQDYPKYDFNYKIIIIGNSSVGKTCLTLRASTGEFMDKQPPTLGFEYRPFFSNIKIKY